MDIKLILREFLSTSWSTNAIQILLQRNDARGSAYIICII